MSYCSCISHKSYIYSDTATSHCTYLERKVWFSIAAIQQQQTELIPEKTAALSGRWRRRKKDWGALQLPVTCLKWYTKITVRQNKEHLTTQNVQIFITYHYHSFRFEIDHTFNFFKWMYNITEFFLLPLFFTTGVKVPLKSMGLSSQGLSTMDRAVCCTVDRAERWASVTAMAWS